MSLTSLERVLWPLTGFTKGDLVAYYDAVAPALLPQIAGRALTLGRFPGGVDAPGFAQTECRGAPPWVHTTPVRLRDGRVRNYCVVDDRRSLLWVANQSAIELHPFLWRGERPEVPTAVVFDLDPGPGAAAGAIALRLRELLADCGLESFVKSSGSTGLHVLVPLNTPCTFTQTKAFARALAGRLASESPDVATAGARAPRANKVYVDWTANNPSRSTIAAYSLRATDFPAVSTPLRWNEVEAGQNGSFDAREVLRRLDTDGDPLAPALELRQALPDAGAT